MSTRKGILKSRTGLKSGTTRDKKIQSSSSKQLDSRSKEVEAPARSSRMAQSILLSSEEYFEFTCNPCETVSENSEAVGFCIDCDEYLCKTCFRSHSRGKATKDHALLDKANMPLQKPDKCDPCKMAKELNKAIGLCMECGEHLCSECFKIHSRSKATKDHHLTEKEKYQPRPDDIAISVEKIDIGKRYRPSSETYKFVKAIYIKDTTEDDDCFITDMTLLSNSRLILADDSNKTLKLIDTKTNKVKYTLKLKSSPFGVTTISENELAVTLADDKEIKVVAAFEGLSVRKTLKTRGYCLAIQYMIGRFYVSFTQPVEFHILGMKGEILKTIKPHSEMQKYCKFPRSIAVATDESMIYISDWKSNNVLGMDINGNMVSVYQRGIDGPSDIKLSPFGSLYLCNMNQDDVYKMTSDLGKSNVVLRKEDGLDYPCAICFDISTKRLYVSSGSEEAKYCNYVKVFEWDLG